MFSSPPLHAQTVVGRYVPAKQEAKKNDEGDVVVPRVFSSKVSDVEKAEKLDRLYYNLSVNLNDFAAIDDTFKSELIELIKPYKFKITRRGGEFKKTLSDAMKTLNDNYKKMITIIKEVDEESKPLRDSFVGEDKDIIAKAWKENIKLFKKRAYRYFKLQNDFLNTYSALVRFILDQGGKYAYDSKTKGVVFFNMGSYTYYGKTVDKLAKIARAQKLVLRETMLGMHVIADNE